MDLDARKSVFGGLQTTKRRSACGSAPLLFAFWKLSIFWIISLPEETGLSLTLSETPKSGFLTLRHTYATVPGPASLQKFGDLGLAI